MDIARRQDVTSTICLAVPTVAERGEGLLACLSKIAALEPASGVNLHVLIVQNGVPDVTLDLRIPELADFPFGLTIVVEPKRGIPFARNKALACAQQHRFDYLGFVDDDAEPDQAWLRNSLEMLGDAEAVTGPQIPRIPSDTPERLRLASVYRERRFPAGKMLTWAATNNVIFSLAFVKSHDLWFDEDMQTGGSDKEFFLRFTKAGGRIVWAPDAVIFEDVEMSRLTMRWIWAREWRKGATEFYIMRSVMGTPKALLMCIVKSGYYCVSAIGNLARCAVGTPQGLTNALSDTAHGVSLLLGVSRTFRPKAYI